MAGQKSVRYARGAVGAELGTGRGAWTLNIEPKTCTLDVQTFL